MQPEEKRTLSFDFTSKLKAGDAAASVNAGYPKADAGLTLSAPSLVGNVVSMQVSVSSAAPPNRYNVACQITTVSGDILELDCFVRISGTEN
jgi:hypothetical protein